MEYCEKPVSAFWSLFSHWKVNGRILAKLAKFYSRIRDRVRVKTSLYEALRLDPVLALNRHPLKRFLFALLWLS